MMMLLMNKTTVSIDSWIVEMRREEKKDSRFNQWNENETTDITITKKTSSK